MIWCRFNLFVAWCDEIKVGWAYREKSTISSHVSLPDKELQLTQASLLRAHRFMTYEYLQPHLTLRALFILSCKSYLLVKRS